MKTCFKIKKWFIQNSLTKTTLTVLAAAAGLLAAAPARAALPPNTSFAHGGNWSQDYGIGPHPITDVVYNAGIDSNTTPAEAIQITDTLIDDYDAVGMNFVRFHVNPAAVSSNWVVTTNCINELINNGMYVDINCLDIDPVSGTITNIPAWSNMWKTINSVYGSNTGVYTNVYFEPINEPYPGYTTIQLSNLVYYPFLHNYGITKAQDHIILDTIPPGAGSIGPMSAFSGCLICVHDYDFVGTTNTYAGWVTQIEGDVPAAYRSRTIMNEWGATTTNGSDFLDSSSTDSNVQFVWAMCDLSTSWNMGLAWYPAHQRPGTNPKHMFNGVPGAPIVSRTLIDKLQNHWSFYTPLEAPGCDFNNFGQTDYSLYRPSSGSFEIQSGGGGHWGQDNLDIAVPADYNGLGTVQMATWRPTNGCWYVYPSFTPTQWGTNGDIPVPGDYLGTGKAQFAVFRPSTGTWWVKGGSTTQWGTAGDIPVPGYYNGDGHLDVAVYRPSDGKYYIYQGAGPTIGQAGDIPVPGDYARTGLTQPAVYRPSNSTWYIYGVTNIVFGTTNGAIPVPGDYTGSGGYTQMALWNPTNFVWNVDGLAPITWGTTDDIPLPLPYAIRNGSLGYDE